MFENTTDYNDTNAFTVLNTKDVLHKYLKYIKFGKNDLILDAGSGSGNVTTEVLIPSLPKTNYRLVGIDRLQVAVDFANKNFSNSKASFRAVDMVEKTEQILKAAFTEEELNPGFDLVFSFSVVQWTSDVEQFIRNMFALMKPGGQALFWFVGYTKLSDLWQTVIDKKQWQSYIKEPALRFMFHESTDVVRDVTGLLKRIGFDITICDCVTRDSVHDINYNWRKSFQCIDPNMNKIPEHLHSQYMDDLMSEFTQLCEKNDFLPYHRIDVVASKPTV